MAAKIFMDLPGGLKMPALGLGTWQSTDEKELESALNTALESTDEKELESALNTALEVGYRHIDTAFVYQNEAVIGRVLKEWLSAGKLKREDLFITTKLPMNAVHPERVETFMKKSLENLQLDYVDLYLIHFPVCVKYVEGQVRSISDQMETEVTDHVAVWKKMEAQVDAGRTKAIGISNFNIKQVDKILKNARIKPASLQVELHVYLQQRELVKFCQEHGIVVVAYSPLGSPGYNKFVQAFGKEPKKLPDMLNDPVITNIAKKYNKSNAHVMLRYLVQKKIVPIPKSVTPARIKSNIDIFDFSLDAGDVKALDDLEVGEDARICDFQVFKGLADNAEWPFRK